MENVLEKPDSERRINKEKETKIKVIVAQYGRISSVFYNTATCLSFQEDGPDRNTGERCRRSPDHNDPGLRQSYPAKENV